MKYNVFIALILSVFVFIGCGSDTNTGSSDNKESVVITTERTVTENNSETTGSQENETVTNNASELVFEGEFKDGSPLDQTFYYFFKDKNGKEMTFFHDPAANPNVQYTLIGPDLKANSEFVGKSFKVFYKTEERQNENTGDMEKVNIPVKLELAK